MLARINLILVLLLRDHAIQITSYLRSAEPDHLQIAGGQDIGKASVYSSVGWMQWSLKAGTTVYYYFKCIHATHYLPSLIEIFKSLTPPSLHVPKHSRSSSLAEMRNTWQEFISISVCENNITKVMKQNYRFRMNQVDNIWCAKQSQHPCPVF